MNGEEIGYELNRSAFIITSTQAFHDMIANIFNEEPEKEESVQNNDSSRIYLVSADFFNEEEAYEYLEKNYMVIFEQEIEGWITDESLWPQNITWDQFKEWFNISFQSMVFDLEAGEPVYEE
ncbi:MAG: hypothetical protein OEZ22_04880 [Spirochaetia bacterium]|nr:hypothetical protein [Spirochaetia bacterium]